MGVLSVILIVLGIYMLSFGVGGIWGLVFIALGALYFLPLWRPYRKEVERIESGHRREP